MQAESEGRVAREIDSHTRQDVLGASIGLKKLFAHTELTPARERLDDDLERHLGDVRGLRVLDLGCGHGGESLELVKRGAVAVGIDISPSYVERARARARSRDLPGERLQFCIMDAHALAFADGSFDLVAGRGILHHLDLSQSLGEIRRVLKPGGRALFVEPLAANPLLRLFRALTPRARTVDERPLTRADLEQLSTSWDLQSSYYGLITAPVAVFTSILLRPFPRNPLLRWADCLERSLNRIPALRPWNQYVLLSLARP
jgi:SAM-dependent methyltransferase